MLTVIAAWVLPSRASAVAAPLALPHVFVPGAAPATACASLGSACFVAVDPALDTTAIGTPRTFTFTCEAGVATLTGPAGNPYPIPGCFDVTASVTDLSRGDSGVFNSATCGGFQLTTLSDPSCSTVINPLCAVGYVAGQNSPCSPCPGNYNLVSGSCHGIPSGNACAFGSPVTNTGGGIIGCVAPQLPLAVTDSNQFSVTLNSGAPHIYEIDFHGFIGTTSDGTCPQGTTLLQQSDAATPLLTAGGGSVYVGPVCQFDVKAHERYIQITKIVVTPNGPCGAAIKQTFYSQKVGQGCLVGVQAFGTLVIKANVGCTNEPPTGTSAVTGGFPAGTFYQCTDNALLVQNIPVSNVPITLQPVNGIVNPTCFPIYAIVTPTTPTVTATPVPGTTRTPPPTPSPTPTVIPPLARASGASPAFCGPAGQTSATFQTNANGQIQIVGTEVEYSAIAHPYTPPNGSNVSITGQFDVDNAGQAGVAMYTHTRYAGGIEDTCGPVLTDASGSATCTQQVRAVYSGVVAQVDVDFIANCTDFMTSTSFVPDGSSASLPTPTPTTVQRAPAPNGACLLRNGPGELQVNALFQPSVDTQPSVQSGLVNVGSFPVVTPAVPTQVAIGTVTNTPVPSPTTTTTPTPTSTTVPVPVSATPTPTGVLPTPTNTPVPTSTPTPTPLPTNTPTATPVPPLSFTFDSADVTAQQNSNSCGSTGLDVVMQGQQVCLMIVYTVNSIPKDLTRVTTYQVLQGSQVVFSAQYRGTQSATEPGTQARFAPWTVPANLAPGVYIYRATLKIGNQTQTREWQFAVTGSGSIGPFAASHEP